MPRKNESMLCRNPGCDKPHEFLQHQGKYYCLECFDDLTSKPDEQAVERIVGSQAATATKAAE